MSFIVIVGCDGSGKSTVIEKLIMSLESRAIPVKTGHWRPSPFTEDSEGMLATADDPHGQVPRGLVSSVAKLVWIGFNWWAGWLMGLRAASRRGVVIYDRYYGDLLVDPKRYRYGGPRWVARLWTKLLPKPDLVVFLDADEDILLARKQEVPREALSASRSGYTQLINSLDYGRMIDASAAVDEVVSTVGSLIHSDHS